MSLTKRLIGTPVLVTAGVTVVVTGGVAFELWRRTDHALAELVLNYRADQHAQTELVARDLEGTLRPTYEGLRTMSRLPSVRTAVAMGHDLTPDAVSTVQEVYANLAGNVSLSEVYLVPVDLDPDAPVGGDTPREPLRTFDAGIVGRTAASTSREEVPEVEEFEYREMKRQMTWLRRAAPTQREGMDVPVVTGPELVTCDNSHYDPAHPDDRDRSGIVITVPVYAPGGSLAGGVSGVIRSDVLRAPMRDGPFVMRDADHDLTIGRRDNAWAAQASFVDAARPDPAALYSEVRPLRLGPGEEDWYLWVAQPDTLFWARSDVRGQLEFFRLALVVVVIGGAGLGASRMWSLATRADDQARVAVVVDIADAAACGRLDLALPPLGHDPIGRLARTLDGVLESMRTTLRATGAAEERLGVATHRLSASCRNIGVAADATRVEAREVCDVSTTVAADVEAIASSMNELCEGIRQVAAAASGSSDLTAVSIQRLEVAMEAAGRLSLAGEEIGEIVRVIGRITEATRILALNATIEAARTGEAGRGFAVVAREVGTLSKETAEATRLIESRVQAFRTETVAASEAIESIGSVVLEIASRQHEISSAARDQSSASAEVAAGASRAAAGAMTIRARMQHLNEVATEASAAARILAEASSGVLETTGVLHEVRKHFVVPDVAATSAPVGHGRPATSALPPLAN